MVNHHKGDEGLSDLLGPGRYPKNDPRFEVLGTIDEASAALGLARSMSISPDTQQLVKQIQRDLYSIMAEVAATRENRAKFQLLQPDKVEWLEVNIKQIEARVVIPREFILPGDSKAGGAFSLARTIIRRAERRMVDLMDTGDIENPDLLRYLNRLSTLVFYLELYENQSLT